MNLNYEERIRMKNLLFFTFFTVISPTLQGAACSNFRSSEEQERLNGELAFTVMNGDFEAVREVLESGADPAKPEMRGDNIIGKTPLTYAIQQAEHDIAALLLAKGAQAKINEPDMKVKGDAKLPLHQAIDRGDLAMTKLLVDNGADIHAHGALNFDAYDFAKLKLHHTPNKEIYKEILAYLETELRKQHPDIDPILQRELNEKLNDAIIAEDEPRVKKLIGQGASPTATVFGDESPIGTAVQYKQHAIAEYLLTHGALVNEPVTILGTKQTLLHVAVNKADLPMIKLLVKHGANQRLSDQYRRSPFWLALEKKRYAFDHQKAIFDEIANYFRSIRTEEHKQLLKEPIL